MNWKVSVVLILVIGVGVWGWYLQRQYPAPQATPLQITAAPPTPPSALQPTPAPATPDKAQPPLVAAPPSLDNSDGQVHAAVVEFAPLLTQWLAPQEQLRKWVALVDQLADGKLPLSDRPLNYPLPVFMTQRQNDKLILDAASYTRSDFLIKVLTAIPPDWLAQYYLIWRPVLDKAYSELGGGGGFDKRLRMAIRRVVAVQPLTAAPELVRPIIYYKYADPTLEGASDVQKLLWRMGPRNSKALQDYLRSLEQAL